LHYNTDLRAILPSYNWLNAEKTMMNTGRINKSAKPLGKTTAKSLNDSGKGHAFACISLFRSSVYFSILPVATPMQAHEAWINQRINYLNKRRKENPYPITALYPDTDDEPIALMQRQNMFCATSNIREFYMHTFISCSSPDISRLYSINLCAEGGIYSTQIMANSFDEVLKTLQSMQKHVFDEYLSAPEIYYAILNNFDSYRVLQSNFPDVWICSAYSQENDILTTQPTQRGGESLFSQSQYTLFIIPTSEVF
jgi:hypothetical protein